MIGSVNKIVDFSVVDGPGNRTAVFFQGCNFRCTYCHNPETINRCINCGVCVGVCPVGALKMDENHKVQWDDKKCVMCDACIKACPHCSSPKISFYTPLELAKRVAQNQPFIRGITCSGGECMLQADFMADLFELTKAMGLTNLIDTNGSVPLAHYPKLLQVTDGVMLDVKCADNAGHKALVGMENAAVLENLRFLAEHGLLTEVRTVIEQHLPNEDTVVQVAKILRPFAKNKNITYKIICYRPFGVRESTMQNLKPPSDEFLQQMQKKVLEINSELNVIIV